MPNIFNELRELDNKIIKENIVMLEIYTLSNLFKGFGITVLNRAAKIGNKIGELINKNPNFKVIKEKRIEDYIDEKQQEIKDLNKEQLNSLLISILKRKTYILKNEDKDFISDKVINTVADYIKVPKYMTVEQKADAIYSRYLKKEKSTKSIIDNIFNIKKILKNEFIKFIITILVMSILYIQLYSFLSFNINLLIIIFIACICALRFIKSDINIKNEIMGGIVFLAVNNYAGSFVFNRNELLSEEELAEINRRDEEYKRLVNENNILFKKINELEFQYKKSKNDIDEYNKKIKEEINIRENYEVEILKLKNEKQNINKELNNLAKEKKRLEIDLEKEDDLKDKLEKSKKLNKNYANELEKFTKKISELTKQIEEREELILEVSIEIDKKSKAIEEKEKENLRLKKEKEYHKLAFEDKSSEIEKTEFKRKKEIKEKWNVYYPNFEIPNCVLKEVCKFSKKEIWSIERALNTLHQNEDYRSLSRGKIKDNGNIYEHMAVKLGNTVPGRILYKINNDSIKRVTIEKIYKHNEKIYQ